MHITFYQSISAITYFIQMKHTNIHIYIYKKFKINFNSIYVLIEKRKWTGSFISNYFINHSKTHFNFQKDKDRFVFWKYLSIQVPDAFICKKKKKNLKINIFHLNSHQYSGYQTATYLNTHTHTSLVHLLMLLYILHNH